jgi:hypothetical protein
MPSASAAAAGVAHRNHSVDPRISPLPTRRKATKPAPARSSSRGQRRGGASCGAGSSTSAPSGALGRSSTSAGTVPSQVTMASPTHRR